MTGIIILAAGSSTRLGSAKQNLIYKGGTLLQKAVAAALGSVGETIVVVLGANAGVIEPTIQNKPVHIVHNVDWEEGMASSIRIGIDALTKLEPKVNAVVLMLCDQPYVDAAVIDSLVTAKANVAGCIAACAYNDTVGPPALFDACYFEELLLLKGHDGAKKLMMKYINKVISVPFVLGGVDIDTIADYDKLTNL
ncbi:hypothetical protein BH09BAC6_BH09BAC6_27680 [soil metagenome]|jgi:molybdenum cofactor cytidylyltransferase